MPAALLAKLSAAWPQERWRDVTAVVAVSGGADSVALLRALHSAGSGEGRLIVAHYNHRLRGAESDADQGFVETLANQLGLEILTGASPAPAASPSPPPSPSNTAEAPLREARYVFLVQAANQAGARYVVTAHTADDQVETVLHNILRGTGLAGLAGIPRVRHLAEGPTIIRPLLDVTRGEVLDYLRSIGQSYRDDSTNRLEDYTRNRIRQTLLPLLERGYNPRVREALLRLAQIAGQTNELLDQQAEQLLADAARPAASGSIELEIAPLHRAHPALVRQAVMIAWQERGWPLQDMTFEKWEQLRLMIQDPDSPWAQTFPGGIRAERIGKALRLTNLADLTPGYSTGAGTPPVNSSPSG
jgi:tRNA(Ile)-lysidine synthase